MSEARQTIEQSSIESVDDYQGEDLATQNAILRRQNKRLNETNAQKCTALGRASETIAAKEVEIKELQKKVAELESKVSHYEWEKNNAAKRSGVGKGLRTLSAF